MDAMNALEMARENMNRLEGGEFVDAMLVLGKVQAYAAIAQAEALMRTAVATESHLALNIQHTERQEEQRAKNDEFKANEIKLLERIHELREREKAVSEREIEMGKATQTINEMVSLLTRAKQTE